MDSAISAENGNVFIVGIGKMELINAVSSTAELGINLQPMIIGGTWIVLLGISWLLWKGMGS